VSASAALLLPYVALAVFVFILSYFVDGDSIGASVVQATVAAVLSAAVWEFIVYVRNRDEV
jgi:hypothetical protein